MRAVTRAGCVLVFALSVCGVFTAVAAPSGGRWWLLGVHGVVGVVVGLGAVTARRLWCVAATVVTVGALLGFAVVAGTVGMAPPTESSSSPLAVVPALLSWVCLVMSAVVCGAMTLGWAVRDVMRQQA